MVVQCSVNGMYSLYAVATCFIDSIYSLQAVAGGDDRNLYHRNHEKKVKLYQLYLLIEDHPILNGV